MNSKEKDAFRELAQQVKMWRRDAIARAKVGLDRCLMAENKGDLENARQIYAQHVVPALRALKASEEGDFSLKCCLCGEEIAEDRLCNWFYDGGFAHVDCKQPDRIVSFNEGKEFHGLTVQWQELLSGFQQRMKAAMSGEAKKLN